MGFKKSRYGFVQAFRENVIRIIGSHSADKNPTEYDKQIEELQKQMLDLIEESAGNQQEI